VSALAGSPFLRRLGQGKGEQLMVGVEREGPALQHDEVPSSLLSGQQLSVIGQVPPLGGVQLLGEEPRGCQAVVAASRCLRAAPMWSVDLSTIRAISAPTLG
jgi:hypothetical protein